MVILENNVTLTYPSGVNAVFGMTFSDFEGGKEFHQGKCLGDAIKASNVRYLIFSGGEQTGLPFMDIKYEIEQYMRTLNIEYEVYLHTVYFYENFISKKGSKRVESNQGKYYIYHIMD
jgi:hypothetical protein